MGQAIILGILFLVALLYLGRFIYKQINTDKDEGHCDKCLPKEELKK